MNLVQESLLKWIDEQEEHDRLTAYNDYYNYYYGDVDLMQYLPSKIKESMKQELKVVANFCKLIVDAKVQYLTGKPCQIVVSGSRDADPGDPRIKEAERDLYHIYNLETNAMLQENMGKLVNITSMKGDAFIKLYHDPEIPIEHWNILDQIQIRVLNPSHVFPKYKDDDYQQIEYTAIKTQDFDDIGNPVMKLQVFYRDHVDFYETKGKANTQAVMYELVDTQDNPDGFIPIQHVKNTVSDLAYGVSDIHVVKDFQNAIYKAFTDLLCTMDQDAFQRLWTAGVLSTPGKQIEMSPGSVIEFADSDASLNVIQPADMAGFLNVIDKLVDSMLMVAQIPKVAAGRADGGGLSGYALRVQYIPLESKASPLREILRNQFRTLNSKIFKMIKRLSGGAIDYTDLESTLSFADGLPIDEISKTQNVIAKVTSSPPLMSQETGMQELGIEDTEEELRRIENEKQAEIYGSPSRISQEAGAVAQALSGTVISATPQVE
jgi:SPP1 family phage portal protein